ncbi:ABC transporter permease [Vibrio sp. SS-MA-C1-2]|uniref:ABC transporter permease n=1 Tax=Vibrio sp. SS-MA-C1-2 TaxID=2908646 RepID=UPI001F45E4B1|nr:ABC transporter permease [Vibrio sp. SS-MA-C1-2]UJF20062.1 ABC transporter permease [Vibrio sp. SS-MA-C1-2]
MLNPIAKTLFGHYRRHPLQVVLVWLGLTLGIALLVGVMAINYQAQASYKENEKIFFNPYPFRIQSLNSQNKIPESTYISLRKSGFNHCIPIDRDRIVTTNQRDIELIGVDAVALFSLQKRKQDFDTVLLQNSGNSALIGEQLANYLGFSRGDVIELKNGKKLGPLALVTDESLGGSRLVTDISTFRHITGSRDFSAIICTNLSQKELGNLAAFLKNHNLKLTGNTNSQLAPLTHAFHLNLFAMGMLAFVVGLFIFYQAISLSLTQRQPLVGQLYQLGVSVKQLSFNLLAELTMWLVLAWISGNILGMGLARRLLPSMAETLNDLYGAEVGLSLSWHWKWGLYSFLMALIGMLFSCFWPFTRLINSTPSRLAGRMALVRFTGREFRWQAWIAAFLMICVIGVYQLPHNQLNGFALIALVLVGTALVMPWVIWQIFQKLSYVSKHARIRWFFSDASASLSYRGVAAMAFMLALSANIGMETMVGSFRVTTNNWLEQRLSADIYINPPSNMVSNISTWLEEQPEVKGVWLQNKQEVSSPKLGTLQVIGIGSSQEEQASLSTKVAIPRYWEHLQKDKMVMISESMAIKNEWQPGDQISLPKPLVGQWTIAGIYYDYGNPYSQIIISNHHFSKFWTRVQDTGVAVVIKPGMESVGLYHRIGATFNLEPERVRNNGDIHQQVMRVFDRTFVVTDALGNLTLFIAICGLFFATVAGELSRLRQFALMRCIGVTGRELGALGIGQLVMIGVLSAMFALPLGLVLAQLLIDVVLKYSFGWSMEMVIFPWLYFKTLSISIIALIVAGAWPVRRLIKRSAAAALRESL